MRQKQEDRYLIYKMICLPLFSLVVYILLISIFTFFHLHLNHDLFTINTWMTEYKWEVLFFVKALLWVSYLSWKMATNPTKGLFRKLRLLLVGVFDSFLASLVNILGIGFFIYFEGLSLMEFDLNVFLLMSFYYLFDVSLYIFFNSENISKISLFGIVLVTSFLNGVFLNVAELLEPALLVCYLLTFGAGMVVILMNRVQKSLLFSFGVCGLALFTALTYSNTLSDIYMIELDVSKINMLILFLSLAISNYFFVILRSTRLQVLSYREG